MVFLYAGSDGESAFFLPQVQQIFESSSDQYRWVIPMTRVVEITKGTDTVQGFC